MRSNRFADNGSSRIAYELCGRIERRKPWLVLIQGLGFDRSGWAPVTSALRRRFRLVLIDNRGSGRSTTPDRPQPESHARRSGFVESTCQRRRHLFRRDAAVAYPRADPDHVR